MTSDPLVDSMWIVKSPIIEYLASPERKEDIRFQNTVVAQSRVMWYDGSSGDGRSWKGFRNMVTITITCPHCGSDQLVRNGRGSNGKQRYLCNACGQRSRANPAPNGYPEERRAEILKATQERSSLRGVARTFGVSRTTIAAWMKKKIANFQR
jgi:transposase-like protein